MPFALRVVSVEASLFEGDAHYVLPTGGEGELGILPGHAPLLGVLVEGEVAIDSLEGDRRTVTVDGGFLSVDSDVVTIVAEHVDASSMQAN